MSVEAGPCIPIEEHRRLLAEARLDALDDVVEALEYWSDQEDVAAIAGPVADVTAHRWRESAFLDAAMRIRTLKEKP